MPRRAAGIWDSQELGLALGPGEGCWVVLLYPWAGVSCSRGSREVFLLQLHHLRRVCLGQGRFCGEKGENLSEVGAQRGLVSRLGSLARVFASSSCSCGGSSVTVQPPHSLQGAVSGSVQATDRLMKELRDIYRSPSFKGGKCREGGREEGGCWPWGPVPSFWAAPEGPQSQILLLRGVAAGRISGLGLLWLKSEQSSLLWCLFPVCAGWKRGACRGWEGF